MPITQAQKERRKDYVGASDMAAILGLSRWATAYDVYLEKTGKLKDEKGQEYKAVGNAFENGILALAEPHLGKLLLNQFRVLKGTKLASNCDAIVVDTGNPAEAKLRRFDDDWGPPDTDEVPDDVIIQAQVQLLCTGKELCHVAAVLAARGFRLQLFHVPFDEELGSRIIEQADKFWVDCIVKDTPPTDALPSADIIKRIKRIPESVVEIDKMLVDVRREKNQTLKAAKSDFEAADNALKAALGSAEAGKFDGGLVTYFEQNRKGYEVKPTSYRVLRIKKEK